MDLGHQPSGIEEVGGIPSPQTVGVDLIVLPDPFVDLSAEGHRGLEPVRRPEEDQVGIEVDTGESQRDRDQRGADPPSAKKNVDRGRPRQRRPPDRQQPESFRPVGSAPEGEKERRDPREEQENGQKEKSSPRPAAERSCDIAREDLVPVLSHKERGGRIKRKQVDATLRPCGGGKKKDDRQPEEREQAALPFQLIARRREQGRWKEEGPGEQIREETGQIVPEGPRVVERIRRPLQVVPDEEVGKDRAVSREGEAHIPGSGQKDEEDRHPRGLLDRDSAPI